MHLAFRLLSYFSHFVMLLQDLAMRNSFVSQLPFSPFQDAYGLLHKSKVLLDLKRFISNYVIWIIHILAEVGNVKYLMYAL